MGSIKLLTSAINLWAFGLFLDCFKFLNSRLIKRNAPISKKHIVFAFKIYERSVNIWHKKEEKHLLLIAKAMNKN